MPATADFLTFHRTNRYGLLNQPKEQFSTGQRSPSVESECIFVQVEVQVRCEYSSLVRSLQPRLQQGSCSAYQWQRILPKLGRFASNDVRIALRGQSPIAAPAISTYHTAKFHTFVYSRYQTRRRSIRYPSKANTANVVGLVFNRNENQRLARCAATSLPWPFASDIRFVHLHSTRQTISTRAYHCSANFMKPYPDRFISLESQDSLQPCGTDPVFLADHIPHRPKPELKGLSCILKYGPRRYGRFVSTIRAVVQFPCGQPSPVILAARASKTIGPSQFEYVIQTRLLRGKPLLEFHDRSWVVFHAHKFYMLGLLESSGYA